MDVDEAHTEAVVAKGAVVSADHGAPTRKLPGPRWWSGFAPGYAEKFEDYIQAEQGNAATGHHGQA